MGLFVGDVDQLPEAPLAGEMGGDGLEVGGCVARQVTGVVGGGGLQPGLGPVVDEQPPHLLERDDADEILDVDAAVAKRPAVAIGLGNLRLEGDDAFEARLELAHRSPRSTTTGRLGRYLSREPSTVPLCSAACTRSP